MYEHTVNYLISTVYKKDNTRQATTFSSTRVVALCKNVLPDKLSNIVHPLIPNIDTIVFCYLSLVYGNIYIQFLEFLKNSVQKLLQALQ